MTDDQGYGDIAAHGNPWIKTPELDKLHSESVRLTDFHVGTTCTPTRAGLLTGRNCNEVGAWHTVGGRSLLNLEETTLAEVLKENGYKTAMFGKWHLGDNSPYLPNNRGFDETLIHGGGGVGQTPDYWDNDYYDDTYYRNGIPEKFEGYATHIWFNEAISFIKKEKNKPFFCYISTNAPHSPFHVPDKYSELYKNIDGVPEPNFYGMITNIDENIGRLRKILEKNGLSKNTILIFLTDNGVNIPDTKFVLTPAINYGQPGSGIDVYTDAQSTPSDVGFDNITGDATADGGYVNGNTGLGYGPGASYGPSWGFTDDHWCNVRGYGGGSRTYGNTYNMHTVQHTHNSNNAGTFDLLLGISVKFRDPNQQDSSGAYTGASDGITDVKVVENLGVKISRYGYHSTLGPQAGTSGVYPMGRPLFAIKELSLIHI